MNLFGTQTAWLWQTHAVVEFVDRLEDSQKWCGTVMPFGGKLPESGKSFKEEMLPKC